MSNPFDAAAKKGVAAFLAGQPLSCCPYADTRKADGRLTFGRAWCKSWMDGYRAAQLAAEVSFPVRRLPANTKGRDFVVGDIHGAFPLLWDAIKAVRFDPAVDRLFSVGDLIDRGPLSALCLEFIGQPWFHAVRGNHEDMLLNLYANGVPDKEEIAFMVSRNGFGWWLTTPAEQQKRILDAVATLPLVIEVPTSRGTVGLLHADIPDGASWSDFLASLENCDPITKQTCLWGRSRLNGNKHDGVAGIGRVFVGHTPQWDGARRYGNVYAVDTGAVFGQYGGATEGQITFANLVCCTEDFSKPRLPQLLNLCDAVSEQTSFGAYATCISPGKVHRTGLSESSRDSMEPALVPAMQRQAHVTRQCWTENQAREMRNE